MDKQVEKIDSEYKAKRKEKWQELKQEPNKWKRFWKQVWFLISFAFVWCWHELKDWRTLVIFVCVQLIVGCEVWFPLVLGLIFNNKYLLGVAGTCEAFWLAPFTPFLPLCIVITMGIKGMIDKRKSKNGKE